MSITAEEIKDITLEYRYTSQTKWNEFIDLVFDTAASSYKIKGDIDCSTNPNYPAAEVGDIYRVTVAGKIGGASGVLVEPGDLIVAWIANAGGTQAAVGSSWTINQVGLQDIFQITGNDLSFDVVRDLIQTTGRNWTVTTTKDKTETVTEDSTFSVGATRTETVTDRYSRNISATGLSVESFFDAALVASYVKTVTAVSGDVDEVLAGSKTLTVAGNSTETIVGNKIFSAANFDVTALGALSVIGTLATGDPGAGSGVWKLGKNVVAASVLDATQYIEVEIDGAVVKLCRAS